MKVKFNCGEIDYISSITQPNYYTNTPALFQHDPEQIEPEQIEPDTTAVIDSNSIDSNNALLFLNNIDGAVDESSEDFVLEYVKEKFTSADREADSFFVCNIDDVEFKYKQWESCLPRVKPFYAIKCNPDPLVIRYLSMQGTGFDCASKAEIEQVLQAGVSASRIIYANPCKYAKHIQAACHLGVKRTTFDSMAELVKIARFWPDADLVLRVLPKVFKAQCPLGLKFGALEEEVPDLLASAKNLNLKIIGVSFHVGSGCAELDAWSDSVRLAKRIFTLAATYGYQLYLVDVGGGFPGNMKLPNNLSFVSICSGLNTVLDECFPANGGYEIIAEPGRYFVASAFTLATQVHCARSVTFDISGAAVARHEGNEKDIGVQCDDDKAKSMSLRGYHYYITDGLYGAFNNILYDHAIVKPVLFQSDGSPIMAPAAVSDTSNDDTMNIDNANITLCKVFGPTCDSADIILDTVWLPKLQLGDWLVWYDMGAYTHAASSTFNGIPRATVYYVRQIPANVLQAQHVEVNCCRAEQEHEESGGSGGPQDALSLLAEESSSFLQGFLGSNTVKALFNHMERAFKELNPF